MKMKNKYFLTGLATLLLAGIGGTVSAESYTVQFGDTLSKIAANHQTTIDDIVNLNNLSNANFIQVGQVLELTDQSQESHESEVNEAAEEQTPVAEEESSSQVSSLSSEEQAAKEWIAQKESSGSYTAQNGIYYGRYQLTLSYLNGDLSPENQERVADEYVKSRYGSWVQAYQFWLANGWY